MLFKFINKCQKEILKCDPPSSHVCNFFHFLYHLFLVVAGSLFVLLHSICVLFLYPLKLPDVILNVGIFVVYILFIFYSPIDVLCPFCFSMSLILVQTSNTFWWFWHCWFGFPDYPSSPFASPSDLVLSIFSSLWTWSRIWVWIFQILTIVLCCLKKMIKF